MKRIILVVVVSLLPNLARAQSVGCYGPPVGCFTLGRISCSANSYLTDLLNHGGLIADLCQNWRDTADTLALCNSIGNTTTNNLIDCTARLKACFDVNADCQGNFTQLNAVINSLTSERDTCLSQKQSCQNQLASQTCPDTAALNSSVNTLTGKLNSCNNQLSLVSSQLNGKSGEAQFFSANFVACKDTVTQQIGLTNYQNGLLSYYPTLVTDRDVLLAQNADLIARLRKKCGSKCKKIQ